MPVMHASSRPGYVFLLAVLGVGIIVSTTSFSLMLLGWAAEQNGKALEQAAQALANAQACAEQALFALREDSGYGGSELQTFERGSCTIEAICGSGNTDRLLRITGMHGESTRRLEIAIDQLLPATSVRTWTEVASFPVPLCP